VVPLAPVWCFSFTGSPAPSVLVRKYSGYTMERVRALILVIYCFFQSFRLLFFLLEFGIPKGDFDSEEETVGVELCMYRSYNLFLILC